VRYRNKDRNEDKIEGTKLRRVGVKVTAAIDEKRAIKIVSK